MTELTINARGDLTGAGAAPEALAVNRDSIALARAMLALCPRYAPTPLLELSELASALGVNTVLLKHEGGRLGLGSFKALGGGFAVALRLLAVHGLHASEAALLRNEENLRQAARVTFCAATDGNHGRSVAAAARLFGARCVIFAPSHITEERQDAIRRFGAELRLVNGLYDDAVSACFEATVTEGFELVSDTSEDPQDAAVWDVMAGYAAIVEEVLEQLQSKTRFAPITHVFVQAGVGGLAAAVGSGFRAAFGADRPSLTVVEPVRAACVGHALRTGRPQLISGDQGTALSMLACGTASAPAWSILDTQMTFHLTVRDDQTLDAVRFLARALPDHPVGESGAAGVAGLIAAANNPVMARLMRLDADANVLCIATEGPTDMLTFKSITEIKG